MIAVSKTEAIPSEAWDCFYAVFCTFLSHSSLPHSCKHPSDNGYPSSLGFYVSRDNLKGVVMHPYFEPLPMKLLHFHKKSQLKIIGHEGRGGSPCIYLLLYLYRWQIQSSFKPPSWLHMTLQEGIPRPSHLINLTHCPPELPGVNLASGTQFPSNTWHILVRISSYLIYMHCYVPQTWSTLSL